MKSPVKRKYVIGIEVRTSNRTFAKDVPPLWKKFMEERWPEKIPNKVNQNIMAVYTDYEGDFTQPFTYLIGYEVSNLDNIPPKLTGLEIPAANYEIYTAKGSFPLSMITTWQSIWNTPLERSYTTDFELYPENFNPQGSPEIKIYVAVQ